MTQLFLLLSSLKWSNNSIMILVKCHDHASSSFYFILSSYHHYHTDRASQAQKPMDLPEMYVMFCIIQIYVCGPDADSGGIYDMTYQYSGLFQKRKKKYIYGYLEWRYLYVYMYTLWVLYAFTFTSSYR